VSNNLWKFQRGNHLVEIDGEREKITKCELEECTKAWSVHYVIVDGHESPILEFKNKFIFNGEEYSSFNRRLNLSFLARRDEAVVFVGGKVFKHEGVKASGFTKSGLSLVNNGFTTLYSWDGTFKDIPIEGIILRIHKGEVLYTDLRNRIFSNDRIIGICNGTFDLISKGYGWVLGSCNGVARYYFQGAWRDLETSIDALKSDGSQNFLGIVSHKKALIFDQDLSLKYRFKESVLGIGLRKAVLFTGSKLFKVDLVNGYDPDISKFREGIVIKYPKGYNLEKSEKLISVGSVVEKGYVIETLEYFGDDGNEEIIISSEFLSFPLKVQLAVSPIKIMLHGKIYVAEQDGKTKSGEGNAVLSGKIMLSRKPKVKLKLIISIESMSKDIVIDSNKMDLSIPFKIGWHESDVIPVNFNLRLEDKSISKAQFIVPLIKVEKPKTARRIRIHKGHVILDVDRYESEMFMWDNVRMIPTYSQPVKISHNFTRKSKIKLGKHLNFLVKQGFVLIRAEDLIDDPKIEIEGNQLCVTPVVNLDTIIQVYYATHVYTGFRTKIIFPLDPAYNTIIIRLIIGNAIVEKTFVFESLKLGLITAVRSANALSQTSETIGALPLPF
ncbi:protein UpsX, partial [Sulfuracidifex metallicus]|uniref:protein UpsX n=1 Tax=Sulfuracidifex metallicus TaxID=47303 RepID=UPI0022763E2A